MDNTKTCLVIDARKLANLQLDGPALRIRLHTKSNQLFPLRRLARIHILGPLANGLDALVHCAENQIPVAFFSAAGKLRCQLYYPVYKHTQLSHWLDYVEFDPEISEQYSQWLQNQMLHTLAQLRCNTGAHPQRKVLLEQRLRDLCNRTIGHKRLQEAEQWLNGMLVNHLSHLLADHGLANNSRNKRKLLEDLLPICELWLLYHLTEFVVSKKKLTFNAQGMSDFYHSQSPAIDYTVKRMLVQLMGIFEAIV